MLSIKLKLNSWTSDLLRFPFINSLHAAKRFSTEIISSKLWRNRILPLKPPPQRNSDHIDVLQKSINAYKIWNGYLPHLTKLHRYSLGVKIDEKFLEFIDAVFFSVYSSKESRASSIRIVSQKLDLLKLSLRIAWEIKVFDDKKYSVISIPLAHIGKIIGGWKQQLRK